MKPFPIRTRLSGTNRNVGIEMPKRPVPLKRFVEGVQGRVA